MLTTRRQLFTTVPDYSWHPTAPDGNPPLAILLDTATFIGNGSVPLGLMVLGSTLGRMRIPRPISRLPLGSIFALALAKVVLLPIIGFVFVRGLATHTGLVNKDNHVLQFVVSSALDRRSLAPANVVRADDLLLGLSDCDNAVCTHCRALRTFPSLFASH